MSINQARAHQSYSIQVRPEMKHLKSQKFHCHVVEYASLIRKK